MNTFLKDLNKIWKEREDKQIAKIKSDCNHEVQFLRRQVQFKKPYNKVMHQTEVKRLKDQLKDTKSALRQNVAVIQQDVRGPNTDGLLIVDQTLKYTNEIQMERRKLKEEKEDLQKQVDLLKLEKVDEVAQRNKFYEGASWLGRQALNVCADSLKECEDLKLEYHRKLVECGDDQFLKGRAAEWFVEKAMRINQHTKDENQRLLETAIRNQ